jgi:threonine dehydratase
MIPPLWISQACRRLEGRIGQTPLTEDPQLNIFLKWENRQQTGSFKIRGALNKVLTLERAELERGLVTASAGNHGQGVAVSARQVGAALSVFASQHAVPAKLEAMRALGAELHLVTGGYAEAEKAAIAHAAASGKTWVSPYNDEQVIAGQGTLGLEVLEQLREKALSDLASYTIVVPAGGGGLVAGIGAALQGLPAAARPKLVAAQSEASPYLFELYQRGSQAGVVERDSLADGLAGAVEPGSLTIELTRASVDRFVLVTEEQIARSIAYAWARYGEKIEGSAAVPLAAVLFEQVAQRPAVVLISGGNIQPEVHAALCAQWGPTWNVERSQ